jgi:hypothetical protein
MTFPAKGHQFSPVAPDPAAHSRDCAVKRIHSAYRFTALVRALYVARVTALRLSSNVAAAEPS